MRAAENTKGKPMHRIIVPLASAGALLCASAQAQATPREERLITDMIDGLTQVCLTAQRSGIDTKTMVAAYEGPLTLLQTRFSNTTFDDAWRISEDGRAYVIHGEQGCTVSAEVRGEDVDIGDALHAALKEISVSDAQVSKTRDGAAYAYCVGYADGGYGSFNYFTTLSRREPGLGRTIPIKVRSMILTVPPKNTCGVG